MKKINSLLEKFQGLKNTRLLVRQAAKEAIQKIFLLDIPIKNIDFRNKTVLIRHPGPLKAEIVTRQKEILETINQSAGAGTATAIR